MPEAALSMGTMPGDLARGSLQGIGLFVVQSILLRHKGELLLENPASGGAMATLVLPCHKPTVLHAHEALPAT
jgi:K+-sensing histidine kinase KdpD